MASIVLAAAAWPSAAAAAGWTAPRTVSTGGAITDVVVDGTGRVTMLWTPRAEPFGASAGIMVTEARAGRGGFRTYRLSDRGSSARLAVDGRGRAVAAWVESAGSACMFGCPGDLRVATKAPGRRFGAPRTLAANMHGSASVAVNARGDAVVAGARAAPGTTIGGQVTTFSRRAGRTRWSTQALTGGAADRGATRAPSLSIAPDGSAVVAWPRLAFEAAGSDVRTAIRAGHRRFGAARVLARHFGAQVAAVADRRGQAVVVWANASSSPGIFAARRTARGGWSRPRFLGSGAGLSVTADAAGNALALWQRQPRTPRPSAAADTFAARRPAGGGFTAPVRILPRNSGAVAAVYSGGSAVVAWTTLFGSRQALRVATMSPRRTVGPARQLARSAVNPSVKANPRGAAAIAFTSVTGSDTPTLRTRLMLSTRIAAR